MVEEDMFRTWRQILYNHPALLYILPLTSYFPGYVLTYDGGIFYWHTTLQWYRSRDAGVLDSRRRA